MIKLTPDKTVSVKQAKTLRFTNFDLLSQCQAVANSLAYIKDEAGREPVLPPLNERDYMEIDDIVKRYAQDPVKTADSVNVSTITKSAAILEVSRQIREFGEKTVTEAHQIRNLVVNKLILESDNPDPRVRLKAIELLGKLSDVGAFTEKSEVTVTHQNSDQLREALRSKLSSLIEGEVIESTVAETKRPVIKRINAKDPSETPKTTPKIEDLPNLADKFAEFDDDPCE